MSLILRRTKYEIPKPGPLKARLREVSDLGVKDTKYGKDEWIRFVWAAVDAKDSRGQPLAVHQDFTRSLAPRSNLTKAIQQLTGKDPGDEFNLAMLVGIEATLLIVHRKTENGTFANVEQIIHLQTPEEEASEQRVARALEVARNRSATPEPPPEW